MRGLPTSNVTAVHALWLLVSCTACGDPSVAPPHDADVSAAPDGGVSGGDATTGDVDASTPADDAGLDAAEPDADVRLDASAPPHADGGGPGADGGEAVDATPGPEPCGASCVPAHPCETATCVDDRCLREPEPDGTACSEDGTRICVAGGCTARGCGDGYVEPGPSPAPEACDDGNGADGDACSAACTPAVVTLASAPDTDERPAGPARSTAEAEDGRVLVVWTATTGGTERIEALRLTAAGVALDAAPRIVAAGLVEGWPAEPTVAAAPGGGWLVAWSSPGTRDVGAGIALARIERTGASGRPSLAHDLARDAQYEPRLAALGDRAVVVWTDGSGAREEIHARMVHPGGSLLGTERVIAEGDGHCSAPAVAAADDRWMVAWTEEVASGGTDVRARRLELDRELDATPLAIATAPDADEHSPAVAAGSDGFLIAWSARQAPQSTVHVRTVTATGVSAPVAVTTSGVALAPVVAEPAPGRVLVAWQTGWRREGIGWALLGGAAPTAATTLDAAFAARGVRSDVSVSGGSRGTWLVWSDEDGGADGAAGRSLRGFLLPPG